MQTNKGRKVVRESYDSEAEKAYGWVGPDLFSEFFIAFSYTHFASLDTPEPLLYHSALISTFIDIWNSIDRSFSLLPLRTSIFIVIVTTTVDKPIPPLSPPLLRSHFPCLSLYNPFATAVPTTTSAINDLGISPTATRPNPLYDAKFL